ncbi:[FeFe] hydrogenase H-cluster maturation GTPase HydF [Shewanella intestini]|uniref:[FeFe] hydrogenase H-cluster maturation GTPase HydF n=1 Tax=Shewanella intestini TaxID=2017544 RepID=A0ABS5I2Y9_9GAMM|nr:MULTISPECIES: [FeFe] hydrogenase H-cluster maturation GTPase HydF [Shewanella]MBR9728397.1 [FeFe] hydrogenase H-cluster maturation GTPase HydF [Shewanella intestini]MRG36739.1 [FeFe] hydrogenase H-cluster maturation GTPase HydF [Shewanella sp. XMDDZSB0408]
MCQGINPQSNPSQLAPRGMRHQIALLGRRNAGKSSILNMMVGQQVSIVSDIKGTTTDAVAKPYELLPLGPVTFFDTAGVDDGSELGPQRIQATLQVMYRADIALLVTDEQGLTDTELALIAQAKTLQLPLLVVFNKTDLRALHPKDSAYCTEQQLPFVAVSAATSKGNADLKQAIYDLVPEELKNEPALASDLYQAGDHVVCVVPIDTAAPKGRLILPQVQILREALDNNAIATVVKETQLPDLLQQLPSPPALIISDAQVIKHIDQIVPQTIPLTTFSTLFARFKGDLTAMEAGAEQFDNLQDGDKILICEACSHNPQADDIGRVKLPKWINSYTNKQLEFEVVMGHDFPNNLEEFALVVHCGACMFNRTEMLRRVRECQRRGVAITNYGVAISKLQGVLPRIMKPFKV